ncbi:MAG: tyrosine--tRNA ligase, partial [Erysipelothrix sp.]|nr:tyrosine--tRNA ligase [Erysipelothrix sp.]
AQRMTKALFSGDVASLSAEEVRSVFKDSSQLDLANDGNIVDVLVDLKVFPSKREARQLITSNSVSVNGKVVNDLEFELRKEDAMDQHITLIRRGKKTYFVINHV